VVEDCLRFEGELPTLSGSYVERIISISSTPNPGECVVQRSLEYLEPILARLNFSF
jgi:hypothetical protein